MRSAEPGDGAGPVVSGRGLVVRRGGQLVLDDLSFSLAPGEVTRLLGPSGCGKTTLMRVLVGVQAITAGTVDAMQRITAAAAWTSAISADVAIILAFTVAAVVGGALTLRRRTA